MTIQGLPLLPMNGSISESQSSKNNKMMQGDKKVTQIEGKLLSSGLTNPLLIQ